MNYCFDSIFVKNNVICASGWAVVSDTENELKVTVTDTKDNPVESKITWAARPDVGLAMYGDPTHANVGFFIEIPCSKREVVKITFTEIDKDGEDDDESRSEILNPVIIAGRNTIKKAKSTYTDAKKNLLDIKKKMTGKEYADYDTWIKLMNPTFIELNAQKNEKFAYMPKFSIIVPLFHTKANFLRDMIRSVIRQSYSNWELVLVNASPEDKRLSRDIKSWATIEKRIKVVTLDKNLGIADNTNAGLKAASGDFVAFLDHDDFISEDALYWYVKALNKDSSINILYSDEDKTDEFATHYLYPHFKSDYNPDLLHCNNYMCHFLAVRKSLADFVGGFDSKYDGAQDYDFVLKLTEHTDKVYHCPRVLYHWRCTSQSTAEAQGNKPYFVQAGADALNAHYARLGWKARAEVGKIDGWYTTRYEITQHPFVSVIIPNKDHIEDLDVCLQSFFDRATYDNYEFIVVENNSTKTETFAYYNKIQKEHDNVKVVYWDSIFNYSAINNFGAKYAKGEYIMLLNNDVELISPDIFESMLSYCMRPEVGIVGVKLLYNDHTVQHAGVLVGAGGLADHVFKGLHEDAPGYMGRAVSTQDVSAVTAACLMVKRSVFDEVGGLEESFQVAFNDVDFCLKVRKAGYLIVYDADVRLFHYESKSRGVEDTTERFVRFGSEMAQLNSKWHIITKFVDPYYNSNMSYLDYYKLDQTVLKKRLKELRKQGAYEYDKQGYDRHSKLQR